MCKYYPEMDTDTKRLNRIRQAAFNEALRSDIQIQHGAVITKGSKIVARGCNHSRSSFLNKKRLCVHAEMDAAQQLIKTLFHRNTMKPDKRISKYIVWVIRLGTYENGETCFRNSKPCDDCLTLMNHLGFKKVGFTDDNGDITINSIENLMEKSKDYFTTAHRYFKKICNTYH